MSEMFDLLSKQPANIVVFNAMVELCDDVCEHFKIEPNGDNTSAKIEVFVNGIAVPFERALSKAVAQLIKDYDKDVKEAAINLLTESPLADLYNEISCADWKIRQQLDKIMKSCDD